jgi:hypothetical protein
LVTFVSNDQKIVNIEVNLASFGAYEVTFFSEFKKTAALVFDFSIISVIPDNNSIENSCICSSEFVMI